MKFNIEVDMQDRWVPYFLNSLKYMEYCGNIGTSRRVSILSDGDGDFRPTFKWNESLPSNGQPESEDSHGNRFYDAG